eukprot:TRINITY_DN21577_c0_g1_i1.p1 TRINITY_DN21577_c0_g1~~TRINITY_DN21577_c0_g1_i1.p1  ORF type:complete len:288 (+),score=55.13 TRINITY_DN21577_c0_g1_i1:136-999(+)
MAASSSSPQETSKPSPSPQPSRKFPPPCWTHQETLALIDSYRQKWYSLRRGNLRASHWQEVADSVARLCGLSPPTKTAVQCRHKIEKLRKRYRSEKQRSINAGSFCSSSWAYFRKMDSMEAGPSSGNAGAGGGNEFDSSDEEDGGEGEGGDGNNTRSLHHLMSNGGREGGGFGVPLRSRVEENPNPSSNKNPRVVFRRCSERDPVAEMVSAIKLLGEGFVKVEQMKMEMAREIEKMRMEMEIKRTEMILESQQRIVESFAMGFCGKKKVKRMSSGAAAAGVVEPKEE